LALIDAYDTIAERNNTSISPNGQRVTFSQTMTHPLQQPLSASTPNLFMSERKSERQYETNKPALRRDNFLVNSTSSFDHQFAARPNIYVDETAEDVTMRS
jgi:hypothetical protein